MGRQHREMGALVEQMVQQFCKEISEIPIKSSHILQIAWYCQV